MRSLQYLFLAILLAILGCRRQNQGAEASGNGTTAPKAQQDNNEIEVEQGEDWGYEDKPSPDVDLTRDAPLEIKGGLAHDIGALLEGEKRIYTLVLKNTSDKPWKLQSVDADCGCTNIEGFPGGVMMQPGKELPVVLRIDGSRIGSGPFEKHVMFSPLEYKTVRVAIKGKIERFFATVPKPHRIQFNSNGDPEAKWEKSIEIVGVGNYKNKLELELDKEALKNPYIQGTLEKLDCNTWKLTARPIKTLPYTDAFVESLIVKVSKPEGMPPITITVQGQVGMKIHWNMPKGRKFTLSEEDFKEGIAKLNLQLGIDLSDPNTTVNERLMKRVENVEWQKLFDTLEFKMPEGVKYEKTFTRFGVKLALTIPRSAFNDKGSLRIESGCNGNWEGTPINLRVKMPRKAAE